MTWTNRSIQKDDQLKHWQDRKSAKQKGIDGEKVVAAAFSDVKGKPAKRNFQGGEGGGLARADVDALPDFHFEVKTVERFNMTAWHKQLAEDCPRNKKPGLVYTSEGKPWVSIRLEDVDSFVQSRAEQRGMEIF